MGRLTVRLPEALHRQLESLAKSEGVSLNQYLVYALTRQATLDAHLKSEQTILRPKTEESAQRSKPAEADDQGGKQHLMHEPNPNFSPPAGK
jgi:hypothetical protein